MDKETFEQEVAAKRKAGLTRDQAEEAVNRQIAWDKKQAEEAEAAEERAKKAAAAEKKKAAADKGDKKEASETK